MAIFLTGYETVEPSINGPVVQVAVNGATVFTNEEYEFQTGYDNASFGFLMDSVQTDKAGATNFVNDRYWFSENFEGAGAPITVNRGLAPRAYGFISGG